MHCASCGFENQQGAQFCEDCGTKLVLACPSCGREVRPTAKFCPTCGRALTGQPADAQSAAAPLHPLAAARPEAERRQLTVEFIDLVGSTILSQQLDPEDYHARVVAYQTACHQVIARYEGHIAQYLGDGVLVYFGYPAAHEDDAVRAVRSGLEIVAGVSQLQFTPPLQVRIGVHTGLVVVARLAWGSLSTLRCPTPRRPLARISGSSPVSTTLMNWGDSAWNALSQNMRHDGKRFQPTPLREKWSLDFAARLGELFCQMGGMHIQIGKYYPYQSNMEGNTWEVLQGVKRLLNLTNLMTPGCLGLSCE